MLETVTIKDVGFWDWDNKCMDIDSYISLDHFNITTLIKDIESAGYSHPADYDSDDSEIDNDEYQRLWSTNIEIGQFFTLVIEVEEEGDIDKNTKWFCDGKQVYPKQN